MIIDSGRQIDFLSERQLDYRYLEYKLFLVLNDLREYGEYSILGLPDSLNNYDMCDKTPLTLNAELYRFYDEVFFEFAYEFADFLNLILIRYSNKSEKVQDIVKDLRRIRLNNSEL
ncbi:MAG: hypothetical protein ACRDD7_13060 [Peptostreptococcaceae bacterium]